MVRRLSLLSYLVAGVAMLPLTAGAAPVGVSARANAMDDYTRIVLDFDKTPSYIANQKSSSLTLTFQSESALSAAAKQISSAPRVTSVSAPDAKHIQFTFADPKEIRHFTIGNRVIIDVYGAATKAKKPEEVKDKPVEKTAPKAEDKAETKPTEKPVETAETKDTKPNVKPDAKETASTDTSAPSAPSATNDVPAPKGAAMLPFEFPADTKLAVYQSGDFLNIVADRSNISSPPLGGDNALVKKIGAVETKNLPNATMFTLKLPKGVHARTEGGNQRWRVIVSPDAVKDITPTAFDRQGSQLSWNVADAGKPITVTDPASGDDVQVVPVLSSKNYTGPQQNFIDLNSLPSQAGLAILPKRDGMKITSTAEKVIIGDGQNLALSANVKPSKIDPTKKEDVKDDAKTSEEEKPAETSDAPKTEAELTGDQVLPADAAASAEQPPAEVDVATDNTRYFELEKWQHGGAGKLESNRKEMEKDFLKKPVAEQADTLISLAKMEIANGMGPEAKGFLDYAVSLVPDLESTPTVNALYGAAESLIGHDDSAFKRFASDKLAKNAEIQMWRAVSLARLEDWAQAEANMPTYPALLETYPPAVQIPMGLTLAEIALRNGNPKDADRIMELIAKQEDKMGSSDKAAMAYLRGESDRQKGKVDDAKKFWLPLTKSVDNLYRVKAGLSLTNLELDRKEITPDEAIDRLEGFRYTWRGDELETAVNFRLGRLYIEKGDPVKGLNTLRQAVSLASPQSDQASQITELMKKTFKDLFLTDKINEISPIDAVTVYEEFAELTPQGDEGGQILDRLSSRLADVDLLPRAAAMLQKKIDQGASGLSGAETATRLADILVMDREADKAIAALAKADELLKDVPVDQSAKVKKQIAMLRAQAFNVQKKPDQAYEALSLLPQDEDVLRLRADIAWSNQRWQEAADALEALVQKSDISPTRPVTDDQGELLLNWAIALHKADNRFVLADIRDRFSNAMAASPYNEKFEIITRSKQNSVVVDRASIDKIINEVDMFKNAGDAIAKTEPATGGAATDAAAATTAPASAPQTAPVTNVPTAPATPVAEGADAASATSAPAAADTTDAANADQSTTPAEPSAAPPAPSEETTPTN